MAALGLEYATNERHPSDMDRQKNEVEERRKKEIAPRNLSATKTKIVFA